MGEFQCNTPKNTKITFVCSWRRFFLTLPCSQKSRPPISLDISIAKGQDGEGVSNLPKMAVVPGVSFTFTVPFCSEVTSKVDILLHKSVQ